MTNKKRIVSLSVLLAISLCAGGATGSAGDKFDKDPKHQLPRPDGKPADMTKPVKVFILMGQSNMVGFGAVGPEGTPGTLETLVKKESKYPFLVDDAGKLLPRSDVRCVFMLAGKGMQRNDWLQPGFGARGGNFGPELGFGHVIGQALNEPVLLIKACCGNRSLGWDYLPPGSERYEFVSSCGERWNVTAEDARTFREAILSDAESEDTGCPE